MNVHARWDHSSQDADCIGWARAFFEAATPYATGGVYSNFMTTDNGGRTSAAYVELGDPVLAHEAVEQVGDQVAMREEELVGRIVGCHGGRVVLPMADTILQRRPGRRLRRCR
jgi:hypothetical protein